MCHTKPHLLVTISHVNMHVTYRLTNPSSKRQADRPTFPSTAMTTSFSIIPADDGQSRSCTSSAPELNLRTRRLSWIFKGTSSTLANSLKCFIVQILIFFQLTEKSPRCSLSKSSARITSLTRWATSVSDFSRSWTLTLEHDRDINRNMQSYLRSCACVTPLYAPVSALYGRDLVRT
ncbi:hypothetical protein CY34DRAFT_165809 [Suillus luteus UH-Slu-Lm8-n1]|uniref:Uncharacterized protein n=1 Tax=Suillus luteus UH-Slu-Lm8-n1 TaxID=930992 RepID=A0A0D0BFH3_9AGAM|nr:hypothetical protein CY34DRAFT_165809 [Suillus luteus UH-Slu-Lm8-n1]